ncbi:PREDICTED: hemK methyltransferase family member 1-like [Dipodomys ordii]|uniref:HemK methyltransferase family member 1-like n=1 Tax=Dipodomys ordii TaxID=10020 RepID=A0A1S3GWB5_DIPOR|nr:PREDICTED: hemK methyltransferase family member 1-like [Dipodomys ordii]
MPVQYILGDWDFCWLNLKMTPPVFIPRLETEETRELVEWVLEEVVQHPHVAGTHSDPLILEVGCDSGAVLLSLLNQLHESQVIAVDKDEASIRLTQNNAQRLRLPDRIWIIPLDVTLEGSWILLLPWAPLDPVTSNPPNVFHQDMEQLAPEILRVYNES